MRLYPIILIIVLLLPNKTYANIDDNLTIKDIHQAMLANELTATELVQHYLKRIKKYDQNGKSLNSIAQLNKDALKTAQALDRKFKSNGLTGVLHGIPILLKDNIDTADGMPNTAGSHALAKHFPKDDAFLVTQLRKAGAIILGKTNLSEWANFRSTSSSSGWSGLYGQTKNPYDISRSPCGSSSGSAVAIAAELATVSIGTETDGSVTCPSAVTGLVGIKPTLGTVSRDGIIPIAHSQDTAGPMAKNVTDAVILLSAIVATDSNDPNATHSNIDYISHLKIEGLKGKRIGIARNLMGYHKELDNTFEQTIKDLKAQGAIIIDNTNLETKHQWGEAEFEVLLYEFKNDLNTYLASTAQGLPKSLKELIDYNNQNKQIEMPYFAQELFEMAQAKGSLDDKQYIKALSLAKTSTQENGIDKVLKAHNLDMLIAPTTAPAWKIDWVNGDNYLGSATSAAAISGYPHITVPMGNIHGLPVGISFFSGKLQEGTLIEAAFSYEQATMHRQSPSL